MAVTNVPHSLPGPCGQDDAGGADPSWASSPRGGWGGSISGVSGGLPYPGPELAPSWPCAARGARAPLPQSQGQKGVGSGLLLKHVLGPPSSRETRSTVLGSQRAEVRPVWMGALRLGSHRGPGTRSHILSRHLCLGCSTTSFQLPSSCQHPPSTPVHVLTRTPGENTSWRVGAVFTHLPSSSSLPILPPPLIPPQQKPLSDHEVCDTDSRQTAKLQRLKDLDC